MSADPDPQLSLVLESQRQLFSSRREAQAREQAGLTASIDGAVAQLAGMRRARGDLQAQADSLREQLANLKPLASEGYIPRNRLLDYQRQLSQVQRDLAQNSGDSARLEQDIVESRLNLQQRREEYQKEVRSQLAEAQLKSVTLEQQLTSAGFDLQHSEILAPADGIAVNLGVHTEGAVVRAGDTLLEVVPQGTALEVEGRLPVNLVDKVAVQLPVDILFTAFNQSSTPRVAGEVALISADQLLDDKTGQPYYVLRSTVSEQALARLNGLVIRPGMPAELFVRTGERSLLNYLFKPLLDRAGTALTEQ
ncbi:Type I secretion system membrane fusion protein PrsE [compost metagenome]